MTSPAEKPVDRLDAFERLLQKSTRETSATFTALLNQLNGLEDWLNPEDFLTYRKNLAQFTQRFNSFINYYLAIEKHIADIGVHIRQQRGIIPDQYYGQLYGRIGTFYAQLKADLVKNSMAFRHFVEQAESAFADIDTEQNRGARKQNLEKLVLASREYAAEIKVHVRGVAKAVLSFYSMEFKQYRQIRDFYIKRSKN